MSRRCQNLYVIEVVFEPGRKFTPKEALEIVRILTAYPNDESLDHAIDEFEEYGIEMSFRSSERPMIIEHRARKILADKTVPGIYYIDLKYAYAYDLNPDRIVLWADGRVQEYTGKIEWTEDPA